MLTKIMMEIGVYESLNQILRDLIIMRLVEPTSKLRSIELMESYFGIKRRRQAYYEVTKGCDKLKDEVEKNIIKFVTQEYGFQFNLIFYDVTTLYYEAFEEDELRKKGYSKDYKSQQPQIVIGLVVNEDGFPITYDIFPGNTFEGKTLIPVIEKLIKKYSMQKCTIVADAVRISKEHIKYLDDKGFKYIIGARIQNISEVVLSEIEKKTERVNGKTCKIKTSEENFLICEYLESRNKREKRELEKKLKKQSR
jgi:transposase